MALIGLSVVLVDTCISLCGNIERSRNQHRSLPLEPPAVVDQSAYGAPNLSLEDAGKQEPCL
jgi:hypothetical protein